MTHGGRVGPHWVGGYTFYMGINREKNFNSYSQNLKQETRLYFYL